MSEDLLATLRKHISWRFTAWRVAEHGGTVTLEEMPGELVPGEATLGMTLALPDGFTKIAGWLQPPITCALDAKGFSNACWLLDLEMDKHLGTDLVADEARFKTWERASR